MKNFAYLTFFILLFQACSNSENSSSNDNSSKLREESTDKEMIKESDAAEETILEKNSGEELIDPNMLASESQPYDITSYFKFFIRDIEEANRVLNTKWDPDLPMWNYEDQLDILDKKAGYMKIVTPVSDGFIYTEYVYWNLSDGRKLFAMNTVHREAFTGEVTTSDFDFKVFNENRWESANTGFLQTVIEEIDPAKPKEMVKSEVLRSVFDMPKEKEITPETHFNFKFALPRKGKDISFWLNYSEGAEVMSSEKIILKFNDGRFEYQP